MKNCANDDEAELRPNAFVLFRSLDHGGYMFLHASCGGAKRWLAASEIAFAYGLPTGRLFIFPREVLLQAHKRFDEPRYICSVK